MLLRHALNQVAGRLGLFARGGVEKKPRAVPTYDDPIVEGVAQVGLQILPFKMLAEQTSVPALLWIYLQAPIVVHQVNLPERPDPRCPGGGVT